jgi:hypothetical protein
MTPSLSRDHHWRRCAIVRGHGTGSTAISDSIIGDSVFSSYSEKLRTEELQSEGGRGKSRGVLKTPEARCFGGVYYTAEAKKARARGERLLQPEIEKAQQV